MINKIGNVYGLKILLMNHILADYVYNGRSDSNYCMFTNDDVVL